MNQDFFEVQTNNNLEQKFIEQEKRKLSDYLQQHFNNHALSMIVVVAENVIPIAPGDRILSKREQYQKMVEQYPLGAGVERSSQTRA